MPGPTNTSLPTLNANGDWSVGSWTAVEGELFYTVELRTGSIEVNVLQTTETTTFGNCAADLAVAGPGQYFLRVSAEDGDGTSDPVNSADVTYPAPADADTPANDSPPRPLSRSLSRSLGRSL